MTQTLLHSEMFFVCRVVVVQITSQISERGFSMVIAGAVSAQRLSIEIRLWDQTQIS